MSRFRLSTPALLAVVIALVFAVVVTAAGWLFAAQTEALVSRDGNVAILSAALGVSRHASLLESHSSLPTTPRPSP